VLFAAGAAYLYAEVFSGTQAADVFGLITLLSSASATLVPVIGLLAGYKAIVGERESGSLKLLLSLPHSRRDVVLGKLVGRTAVVTVAILVGYLVAIAVGVALYASFGVVDFLLFTGVTILLALAYISISLGLSSATASSSRAAALALGFWLIFEFLWGVIALLLLWASNGFSLEFGPDVTPPDWYLLFNELAPGAAFSTVVQSLTPGEINQGGGLFGAGAAQAGTTPFYLQDWFALVVLAFWIVVPVTLGYLRFRNADLA